MFCLKRRKKTSCHRSEGKTVTDPNIPDPGMGFVGKGRLRDEEKPVLTDLREWVGAGAEDDYNR